MNQKTAIPKMPMNDLQRFLHILEDAEPLYQSILDHKAEFDKYVHALPTARIIPGDGGAPLRTLQGINPEDAWLPVSDANAHQVKALARAELITAMEFNGTWKAHPGVFK